MANQQLVQIKSWISSNITPWILQALSRLP